MMQNRQIPKPRDKVFFRGAFRIAATACSLGTGVGMLSRIRLYVAGAIFADGHAITPTDIL
jgi:hypothetical protein